METTTYVRPVYTEQTYKVTVGHPTNFHSGVKTLTVRTETYPTKVIKSVSGDGFGAGRDQLASAVDLPWVNVDDKEAVKTFLAEHACTILAIRKSR